MPEISVIMGVYNELNKDILMEAVNSILHQTFEDFGFIIYDDGSCQALKPTIPLSTAVFK